MGGWEMHLSAGLGALTLFSFGTSHGKNFQFIARFHSPSADTVLGRIFDAAFFIVLGSVVAVLVYQPTTSYQAFMAGLGWTGITSVIKNAK